LLKKPYPASQFLGELAMKKSLVALAVLGLSGAAMAQSSVTLYGTADAGVGKQAYNTAAGANPKLNSAKTHFIGGGLMNNSDSNLGVRGSEDLGGGSSVGFNFETGLSLNDGSTRAGGLSSGFWQRQANMWIGGQWGTVKLGRQFSPSYLATTTYELTKGANYSVLGNTYKYLGLTDKRVPSAFAYISPTFSGLTAAVGFITKTDLGLPSNKNAWDAAVLYGGGNGIPVTAGLGVNKVGNSKTNYQLGGKYNFADQFALSASYTQATLPDSKARRRGFGLGGSWTAGAFGATLDLTRDTKNDWTGKKYTNGVVELKYNLSKRTFVYGAYLREDKTNNYGLGIRHNF